MRHYVVSTQYDVNLQKGLMTLSPFITVRANEVTNPQVDAGLMFNHKEYFYVGAAYRSSYAVTANTGLHLTEKITLGYAYDFSLNTYGFALGNSHEFMLRYTFGESKKDKRLENEIKKLKDRQRRSSEELEDFLNDRLDEFNDEVSSKQNELFEQEKAELQSQLDEANEINSRIKGYRLNNMLDKSSQVHRGIMLQLVYMVKKKMPISWKVNYWQTELPLIFSRIKIT